ncbi:MAG TPA: type II toxin-antitoxin system VapC family toxin [Dehalococcoidia bacterium]|nr:type II toxin-antitoxin system VapC family toxin [Dehalococcoidia bacterium]
MKTLDTTIAIDHLRGRSEATDLIADILAADGSILASEIVRFEILAGMHESEEPDVADFAAAVTWVPVDEQVATVAGELARDYRGRYSDIDDADYLIAATALALDAEILTTNVRHFPMLRGITSPY